MYGPLVLWCVYFHQLPGFYLLFMHQDLAVQGFHILHRQLGGVVAQSVDVYLFGKGGALRGVAVGDCNFILSRRERKMATPSVPF